MKRVYTNISKLNEVELKVYAKLGVLPFRNFLFRIERFRHRKDGLYNVNYHVKSYDIHSFDRFRAYLFYNSFLHCASLLFTLGYFALKYFLLTRWSGIDYVMCILTLFNIYCVMLQRYNVLRTKKTLFLYQQSKGKLIQSCSRKVVKSFPAEYTDKQLVQDSKVILKLKDCLARKCDCNIEEADLASVERMGHLLSTLNILKQGEEKEKNISVSGDSQAVLHLIQRDIKLPVLYTKIEQRIGALSRITFGSRFSIIAKNREIDKALTKLFPSDSLEHVMRRIEILEEVFRIKKVI